MNDKTNITKECIVMFHQCAQEFRTKEDLSSFATSMAGLSIALLRGIEGDAFVNGFLHAAKECEDKLAIRVETIN